MHKESCMLTLTYDNDHLPPGGTLVKKDYQLFLKALRRKLEPQRIRYFVAGEYGEKSQRPHYHFALFGVGKSQHNLFKSTWGKGLIDSGYHGEEGKINKNSAQYISGYVTKKMTNANDPLVQQELIKSGRIPEFGHMSLKPGLGTGIIEPLAEYLTSIQGCDSLLKMQDVPMSLKHDGRHWPLGRYLRKKLREHLGFPNTGAQDGWEEKARANAEARMLDLCVSEGLLGLIEKEKETEETKLIKEFHRDTGWRKALYQHFNGERAKIIATREKQFKQKGRKL